MNKRFQELLHRYKLQVFHAEHDKDSVQEMTKECLQEAEEVLATKYRYHFHKLPDANRAEIINMINNYTREAILPPVVERILARQMRLEKRFEALMAMHRELLEELSKDHQKVG